MQSTNKDELQRKPQSGWTVIHSGDNGVELLQCVIDVADFNEASQVGTELASWIAPAGREDPVVFTQLTLRAWRVEINFAAPTGEWSSVAQQELVAAVIDRFGSRFHSNGEGVCPEFA